MTRLLDFFLGDKIAQATAQHLSNVSSAAAEKIRLDVNRLLTQFRESAGPKVNLGSTTWSTA